MDSQSIQVQSKLLCFFLIFGLIVYCGVLVDLIVNLPNDIWRFVFYLAVGFVLVYGIWVSAIIVELNELEIVKKNLFGFGTITRLNTKDIKKIYIKPNSDNQITRVEIEFYNGYKFQLHYFQNNFHAARFFLNENFAHVDVEILSKWAL